MFIQTESTPNPESLKYVPGEVVLDEKYGTGMYFRQGDTEVNRSPLAKKLLKIGGVQGVFLGRTFITITKSPEIIWQVRQEGKAGGKGGQGRKEWNISSVFQARYHYCNINISDHNYSHHSLSLPLSLESEPGNLRHRDGSLC